MPITIRRARRIVKLVTDMSLAADYDQAKEHFATVAANKPLVAMEVPDTAVTDAAERVRNIEARMAESRLAFTLEAVDRKKFAEFEAANPPREGRADDQAVGLNLATIDPLIAQCIRVVRRDVDGRLLYAHPGEETSNDQEEWVDPAERFDPVEWEALADTLGDGQWLDFVHATLEVNRGSQAPFSRAASLVIQRSEQTSKRPNA